MRDLSLAVRASGVDSTRLATEPTYVGPAIIETYTVLYDRAGAVRRGTIVARTPDGRRTLARVPAVDEAGIAFLTDGRTEPIGRAGTIVSGAEGDHVWSRTS